MLPFGAEEALQQTSRGPDGTALIQTSSEGRKIGLAAY